MENNTPQRESRLVLAILGTLLACICLLLVASGYLVTTGGEEIVGGFQTQAAMPDQDTLEERTRAYSTATAQVALPIVYADDLNSQGKWDVGDSETESFRQSLVVQDGKLRVIHSVKKPFFHQVWIPAKQVDDFYFALDMQILGGSLQDFAGITFRSQNSRNNYTFEIANNATLRVRKQAYGDWDWLLKEQFSEAIHPNTWNRLAVSGIGNRFIFFINGKYVGTDWDYEYKQGAVGIAYQLTEPGSQVTLEYDNFELRALPTHSEATSAAIGNTWHPTLTALATATPSFADDFNHVNLGSKWPTGPYKGSRIEATRTITEGIYRWDVSAKEGAAWEAIPNVVSRQDLIARVRVKQSRRTANASSGLAFHYQNNDNFFRFTIYPDQTYHITSRRDGKWETYVERTYSSAILLKEWNSLQVIARGDRYSFWINDIYVDSIASIRMPEGKTGLAIEISKGETEQFEFDDFEVIPLASNHTRTFTPYPTRTRTPTYRTPTPNPNHSPTPTDAFVTVPNILNLSPERALEKLSQASLRGELVVEPAPTCGGIVMRQDPFVGARVQRGTIVKIVSCRSLTPTAVATP